MKRFCLLSRYALLVGLGVFAGLTVGKAGGDDLRLQAKLIWGTNGSKPDNPKLKEVDRDTAEKLAGVFKWKNYYEVNSTNFTVNAGATTRITMSRKCEVKVQNLGKSKVEVELFGEGKMLVQKRQPIKASELMVLAGPDKNDTAWFVILTLQDR